VRNIKSRKQESIDKNLISKWKLKKKYGKVWLKIIKNYSEI
jgi:hypothetical protein